MSADDEALAMKEAFADYVKSHGLLGPMDPDARRQKRNAFTAGWRAAMKRAAAEPEAKADQPELESPPFTSADMGALMARDWQRVNRKPVICNYCEKPMAECRCDAPGAP